MFWLDLVPPPTTRQPLSYTSFVDELLPPLLSYYVTAVLACLPDTQIIRLALLPATLWMTFRAATSIDLVSQYDDERLIYWNHGLLLTLTTLAMRVISWTFQSEPRRRRDPKTKPIPEDETTQSISIKQACFDAGDLILNLRGIGWDWSIGLQVPPEWRTTSSITTFLAQTFASFVFHLVAFDHLHFTIQSFSPSTIGAACGGTIFDASLPPVQRYLRSSFISFLSGLTIYSAIQLVYDLCTMIGLLVYRQTPAQWPPLFYQPWKATSLNEFWALRWHQLFRDQFISCGGRILLLLLGRPGAVMGVFFMSAVLHHFGTWGMGRGVDFASIGGYFLLMGVGVILEGFWKKLTGNRVQGLVGWIWTISWTIGAANNLIDAWSERGLIGSQFLPAEWRPSRWLPGLVL
ncbi:hypothetical protein HGRIS_003739 [Hohenbuehelia grisea]|uniref:Wax synthase domain-containing protein n=1 Tax=Hohenbuehelia grisea TaxID=104357 RepID=A0ABR3JHY8_9AGAR